MKKIQIERSTQTNGSKIEIGAIEDTLIPCKLFDLLKVGDVLEIEAKATSTNDGLLYREFQKVLKKY